MEVMRASLNSAVLKSLECKNNVFFKHCTHIVQGLWNVASSTRPGLTDIESMHIYLIRRSCRGITRSVRRLEWDWAEIKRFLTSKKNLISISHSPSPVFFVQLKRTVTLSWVYFFLPRHKIVLKWDQMIPQKWCNGKKDIHFGVSMLWFPAWNLAQPSCQQPLLESVLSQRRRLSL